jgi:hypothetical protein
MSRKLLTECGKTFMVSIVNDRTIKLVDDNVSYTFPIQSLAKGRKFVLGKNSNYVVKILGGENEIYDCDDDNFIGSYR